MRRVSSVGLARLCLSTVPLLFLGCGGVEPGGDGGDVDNVPSEEDPLDAGDGGDTDPPPTGDHGHPQLGPAPVDTILIWIGDDEVRFPYASGNYHGDFNRFVVTGDRLQGPQAESFSVAVGGQAPGEFTCDTVHVVSYNARGPGGEPYFWTTRREGGACSITLEEIEEVGGRVIGWFDADIVGEDGEIATVSGAFDVPRTEDQ